MKLKDKVISCLFVFILITSGIIRFKQTSGNQTFFTYDQARDMLDIRLLGEFKDLLVMGPTTSVNGLRLGPIYYYFNLPAYWLGGGNPMALVNWNIIWFLISGLVIFIFFRKRNLMLGFFVSTLYLMAPQLFNITRYFWNANVAVYFSVYYFLALWNYRDKKNIQSVFWLGITSGILTQFEAAFGVVCILFSVLIIIINTGLKYWKSFLMGVIPWFVPQLALEVKNRFQMTKLLFGIFTGQNTILGSNFSILETIISHIYTVRQFLEGQFILPFGWGLSIFFLMVMSIIFFKKYRKYGLDYLGFLLFIFVFYIIFYRHSLKSWYLESLRVWYCFIVGIGLVSITKYKNILFTLFICLLLGNNWLIFKDQWKFTDKNESIDPKNLNNLIKNIDHVYEKMNGSGFKAYNYVPEIYDFSTNYLYWWYGQKKYGYMPDKISYSLSEVPRYIRNQDIFYEQTRKNQEQKIALIYETRSMYQNWLGQFDKYCIEDGWQAIWGTIVEIRKKCKD